MALNSLALESNGAPVTVLQRRDGHERTVFAKASFYAGQQVEFVHNLKHGPFTVGINIRELEQNLRFSCLAATALTPHRVLHCHSSIWLH